MIGVLSNPFQGPKPSHTDEELLAKYKRTGDPAYVGQLYRRYDHKVLGVCLFYLKDEGDSQDAAMDIFVNLLENGRNYEVKNFNSWIYQVTRNYCIKYLQKQLGRRELSTGEFDGNLFVEKEELGTLLYREAVLDRLCEAVEELNEGQRTCIVLFYFKGLSYKEIERKSTYTANEIKSHIQNGKRRLRNILSESLEQMD